MKKISIEGAVLQHYPQKDQQGPYRYYSLLDVECNRWWGFCFRLARRTYSEGEASYPRGEGSD